MTTCALVPELIVTNLSMSLDFWCDAIGFQVAYDRPSEGFAYLKLGLAHLMLEQRNLATRDWANGELTRPFGRGMNLQIEIQDFDAVVKRCAAFGAELFLPPEERWYRRGNVEVGQRQCIFPDPDGYLARLVQTLGERTLHPPFMV